MMDVVLTASLFTYPYKQLMRYLLLRAWATCATLLTCHLPL